MDLQLSHDDSEAYPQANNREEIPDHLSRGIIQPAERKHDEDRSRRMDIDDIEVCDTELRSEILSLGVRLLAVNGRTFQSESCRGPVLKEVVDDLRSGTQTVDEARPLPVTEVGR